MFNCERGAKTNDKKTEQWYRIKYGKYNALNNKISSLLGNHKSFPLGPPITDQELPKNKPEKKQDNNPPANW